MFLEVGTVRTRGGRRDHGNDGSAARRHVQFDGGIPGSPEEGAWTEGGGGGRLLSGGQGWQEGKEQEDSGTKDRAHAAPIGERLA